MWISSNADALRVGLDKIPKTSLSKFGDYLRKGLPISHSNYDINYDKKFIVIEVKKIWLDQCDQNMEYLFKVL